MKSYAPVYYNIPQNDYSSPARNFTSSPSYWNNPNHITISPSKYTSQPYYSIPPAPSYTPQFNYQSPSSFYPSYPRKYSPPKYPYANTNFSAGGEAPNLGQLLNNIDSVLGGGAPRTQNAFSTFERGSSFLPPRPPPVFQAERMTRQPPFLRPRSVSQIRHEEIRNVEEMYARTSPLARSPEAYQPIPAYVKPASPLKNSRQRSPHFIRTSRSVVRPAPDYEIKDAIHTLFR